jgi:hypothetical protein
VVIQAQFRLVYFQFRASPAAVRKFAVIAWASESSSLLGIAIAVGKLRDSSQYNSEHGITAATLAEPFRPAPLVHELLQYLSVRWKSPADAICGRSIPARLMGFGHQATAAARGRHTNAAKQPAARAISHDQTQWPMMRKAPAGI